MATSPIARLAVLWAVAAAMIAVVAFLPALPQDAAYHRFADARTLWGIPNALNVLSNLPFLVVGSWGLVRLARRRGAGAPEAGERAAWGFLFASLALTGLGSAYYHRQPTDATLLWDRLPMSFGFAAFLVALIGERISRRAYRLLLAPLMLGGVGSVLYWYAGSRHGGGDLRPYLVAQFLPLLLVPLLVLLFPPRYTRNRLIALTLAGYLAAKLFELGDHVVYATVGVSGHTLKHLAAALGCWALVRAATPEQDQRGACTPPATP